MITYKTLDAPLTTHLEVNSNCNQRCFHCYNFWRGSEHSLDTQLSEVSALRIADQLTENRVFHVILTGGEPLINKTVLIFIMKEFSKRGITFSLNSNLALLTEKSTEELREAGLRTVLTSLLSYDAATHNHLTNTGDSFNRVVRGIEIARASGLRVVVNMVITKANLTHIVKTGEFARELGAFAFSATRVMAPRLISQRFSQKFVLTQEEVQLIVRQLLILKKSKLQLDSLIPYPSCFFDSEEAWVLLGHRTCSAGKTSIAIASDNSIRACPHHEVAYGSLANEDLIPIWLRMTEWRDGSLLPQACLSCRFVPICSGGCRVASANGNICGEDAILKEIKHDHEFLKKQRPALPTINDIQLRVRSSCRFRQDKALGIINTGGIKNTFVTHETLELLEDLHGKKLIFTPAILRSKYGVHMESDRYLRFFGELIARDVLEYA